jgi:transglutaminase-like putative cysteine protease
MKYRIVHMTKYSGDEPASVAHNEARLRPRSLPHQVCHVHDLQVSPTPSTRSNRTDYFGNSVCEFSFNQGYAELEISAVSDVSVSSRAPAAAHASPPWDTVAERLHAQVSETDLAAFEFVFDSPRVQTFAAVAEYARTSFAAGRPILDSLADLMARLHGDFTYDPKATTVTTPVEEVFELRRGVCQDFAHLGIAAVRSMGLAARYVSGYLQTRPPPGKPRLIGSDASHAWLSVYCGPLGWVEIDPTNNLFPDLEHITLAWGRDYGDLPPIRGVFIGGGRNRHTVSVDVSPIESEPILFSNESGGSA